MFPDRQAADASDLDAIVENGDGHVAARVGVVPMHDCIQKNLAQGSSGDRHPVFSKNLPIREMSRERQGPVQEGHPFPHHGEGMEVVLPIVQDVSAIHAGLGGDAPATL